MKIQYVLLVGMGLLSGVVNVLLGMYRLPFITEIIPHLLFVLCLAGIPFGIVTGLYFIYTIPVTKKYIRLALWIIASAVSYFLGVMATLRFAHTDGTPDPGPINYALGGLIGALVLTLAFHFIFRKITSIRHLVVIVAGGLIPFVIFSLPWHGVDVLYVVWQTVIVTLLGTSYLKNEYQTQRSGNI